MHRWQWLCGLSMLAAATTAFRGPGPWRGGDDDVVQLEAYPKAIELADKSAYAQLLVTGVRRDGMRVDLTREARLGGECALVTVSEQRLVRPQQDGDGELVLEARELSVRVPVRVANVKAALHPSFVQDVVPILSRAGCNAGTCHGSAKGKNGFKLSLRGYDPAFDHAALTDDLAGRRFNRAAPDKSLFLQKPTAAVPHEGGQKLAPGSADYEVVRAWVDDGVALDQQAARVDHIELLPKDPTVPDPGMSQQFVVLAHYQDGRVRDVTAHAFLDSGNIEVAEAQGQGLIHTLRRGDAPVLGRYEGHYAATRMFVMGDRTGYAWQDVPEYNYIDTLVDQDLRRIRALPSELCTDAEFVRRVYLDLCGKAPTRKETTAFLLDQRDSRQKRDELIDRLIGNAEFVEHWTNRWADLLQVNSKFLGKDGAAALRTWIQTAVASNLPYDQFARQLLTASGSTLHHPPAAFYKILREPDAVMESTTQLFLGTRFNCNKCHDHPFERWTQRQHWQLAAWFAQVKRVDAPGAKKMPGKDAMKEGEQPPAYDELISDDPGQPAEVQDPDGRRYHNVFPFTHGGASDPQLPLRQQFAEWLVAKENPYFATSYVNRLWSYFIGSGLIEPVDDLRAGNPPSNPELLQQLTADFLQAGFDVRALMRLICHSRVYQQSVRTNRWNQDEDVHNSHALPRRLPAETLYDAVHQATGSRPRLQGARRGTMAAELVDASVEAKDGFLDLFGRPPRESVCECERSSGTSLGQALNLVNGPTLQDAIEDPDNDIAELVAHEPDARKVIGELYLSFLCREPTAEELQQLAPTFDPGAPANEAALRPADKKELDRRLSLFEEQHVVPAWRALEIGKRTSAGGAELQLLPDNSLLLKGPRPDQDSYTVVAYTELKTITGIRLEALPDDSLPGKGPGRADNGNFVLRHLTVTAVPLAEPAAAHPLALTAGTADFAQGEFDAAQAITGTEKGWAVSPSLGKKHEAWYECKDDGASTGGSMLVFTFDQPYGGMHTLGRFRLSVTDQKPPIRYHGLPDAVAAVLAVPREQRDEPQRAALFRHFLGTDQELAGKIRLGAAQDLTWALVNSSTFLFNR